MLVRRYRQGEEHELWNLFFHTIREVNRQDYTQDQVQAWAPDEVDAAQWQRRIEAMNPYVCEHDGLIVGYAGLLDSGYVDHFYVHHLWQGRGVGKRLFAAILAEATARRLAALTADVSITARPFFESHGFHVVARQEVTRGEVVLTNYRMVRRSDEG